MDGSRCVDLRLGVYRLILDLGFLDESLRYKTLCFGPVPIQCQQCLDPFDSGYTFLLVIQSRRVRHLTCTGNP